MRTSFLLLGLTLGLPAFGASPSGQTPSSTSGLASSPPVSEGQAAPRLEVRDANGTLRRLSDLRGKKSLLITFFPRCFTGNCTSQLTSLRDAYPQLQKAGVEVWAVSTDAAGGPKGQRAFRKYLRLPFPLLPDPDRRLCLLFGAVHTKEQMAARMSVFIDKLGQVRWIDKQMSPRTHGADVLARVRTQAGIPAAPSPSIAPPNTAPAQ